MAKAAQGPRNVRLAAARRLERLDLHMPLSEPGVRAILAEPALSSIRRIEIPREAISSAALRATVAQRHPNVAYTDTLIAPALGDMEVL